jgi:hypothetical protein
VEAVALHVLLVEAVVEVVELLLEVEVVELPHVEAVVVKPSKSIHKSLLFI